ncbi:MAG: 16S rRNA (cytidine(1402)-2'-O)-methyltransferase [Burkholderiaceae bacterium]
MGEVTSSLLHDGLIALSAVAAQELPAGSLHVVGMPIGNAADITLRALWVLSRVDVIAAEDTRVTRPLLTRYGIATPLIAAHQHNEQEVAQLVVTRLAKAERVALVTDAGTPGLADPGARIVRAVLDAGYRVIPVPGASSAMSALSASGVGGRQFTFAGFLPTGGQERERVLRTLALSANPFVLFEAPHRIAALVGLLATALEPERRVVLARELTKKFETVSAQTAAELSTLTVEERGEYVVIVDVAPTRAQNDSDDLEIDQSLTHWLTALLDELPPARAAAIAAKASGQSKQAIYALALRLKSASRG